MSVKLDSMKRWAEGPGGSVDQKSLSRREWSYMYFLEKNLQAYDVSLLYS